MMKKFVLIICLCLFSFTASAQELRRFLKHCAVGTMVGAGLGVVSMAVADKPNESWGQVAKGASLGLYAGIAYGLYQFDKEPEVSADFSIAPKFNNNGIDGIEVVGSIYEF